MRLDKQTLQELAIQKRTQMINYLHSMTDEYRSGFGRPQLQLGNDLEPDYIVSCSCLHLGKMSLVIRMVA